ncbi:MAG: MogA/MoaB family molybdenum cofactor biosynthesis protein [Planctomycetota bacterium]|jgi:molybdopterin biosynthesis enzyme MoaB
MIRTAILTISDSCVQGTRADTSGQTIEDMLGDGNFEIVEKAIVADERDAIAEALKRFCDERGVELILTTGGFKRTPNAILSRGVAGVRKGTLIVNLPGSPKGVRESLEIILGILPHAVQMMRGGGHQSA